MKPHATQVLVFTACRLWVERYGQKAHHLKSVSGKRVSVLEKGHLQETQGGSRGVWEIHGTHSATRDSVELMLHRCPPRSASCVLYVRMHFQIKAYYSLPICVHTAKHFFFCIFLLVNSNSSPSAWRRGWHCDTPTQPRAPPLLGCQKEAERAIFIHWWVLWNKNHIFWLRLSLCWSWVAVVRDQCLHIHMAVHTVYHTCTHTFKHMWFHCMYCMYMIIEYTACAMWLLDICSITGVGAGTQL